MNTAVIIAIVVYAVGSYFDFKYSMLASSVGAKEWNSLMRGKDKKFDPLRFEIFHVAFGLFVVISHYTWVKAVDPTQLVWTPVGLIIVGLVSLAIAFGVDRPLYRKLQRDAGKPVDPPIIVNQV